MNSLFVSIHSVARSVYMHTLSILFRTRDTEHMLAGIHSLPLYPPQVISHSPYPIYSLGRYDTPLWHALIYELKSYKNAHAITLAARPLANTLTLLTHDTKNTPYSILPIPLTPARQRARGYNQITCLLEAVARHAPLLAASIRTDILSRTTQRSEQKTLNRAQREANIAGAFTVPDRMQRTLAGRHCIIVDDVCATGATVRDAARACLEAGARGVTIVVLCNS